MNPSSQSDLVSSASHREARPASSRRERRSRGSPVGLLAWRFLMSKSSEGFLSFIAWVSVLGVSLGVLALTVVTSVINGFEGELVKTITGMNGDLILYTRGEPVKGGEQVLGKIRAVLPGVRGITSSFVAEMMVSGPSGVAGLVLEGVDRSTLDSVTTQSQRIISGRMPEKAGEIVLGKALAERIGATKPGTPVKLIAPFMGDLAEGTAVGGAPRVLPFKVVGLFRMGMYEYDSKFGLADLGVVQQALEQPDRLTAFKVRLAEGASSREASQRLSDAFGYPFRAKDWSQLNRNLFYAIELEKVVITIILAVIVIVAAFNVVSTLMMMIHDKSREIAILKAMGFSRRSAFRLFALVGMGIGAAGTLAGIGVGVGLGWVLGRTRLIQLPEDIYYLSYLPVVFRWGEVMIIGALALGVTFLATLYPSIRVAMRSPLEGIRHD